MALIELRSLFVAHAYANSSQFFGIVMPFWSSEPKSAAPPKVHYEMMVPFFGQPKTSTMFEPVRLDDRRPPPKGLG